MLPPGARASTVCTRYNAVVLYNLDDLSEFFITSGDPATSETKTGLSIASNLPMYVVGDVNRWVRTGTRATDPPAQLRPNEAHVRAALLSPQITVLAPNFNLAASAYGLGAAAAPAGGVRTWNTSLFTSWGFESGRRNPASGLMRTLDESSVNLTGSAVAMMTRGQYMAVSQFDTRWGEYNWVGDGAVSGLPIFSLGSEPDRAVGGTHRFPALTGTDRDLRGTKLEQQPPNAPRMSIVMQPLDQR
jgi:hypothetical protein